MFSAVLATMTAGCNSSGSPSQTVGSNVGAVAQSERKEKAVLRQTYEVALLKIPVSNVKRSAAFYHNTLGFDLKYTAEQYGWAQLSSGDLALALYKPGMGGGDGRIGGSTGFHLSLGAERFDTLAAALTVEGVLVDNRVQHGDDGAVYIEVRDPDGNALKIMRTPPAPQ
jgi:catechol 2,3-dioxygenase-like lactoylglutathione lyase family enzyme